MVVAPTPPGPPPNLSAVPGNAQVSLSWGPAQSNGTPVTAYVISGAPNGDLTEPGGASQVTVSATNEVPVTLRIRARNVAGDGPDVAFPTVTPHSKVPGQVPKATAVARDQSVQLSWTAAPSNGATIAKYVVEGTGGVTQEVLSGTSTTLSSLVNGSTYSFTVRAVADNAAAGSPSASVSAIPYGTPLPPTGLTVVGQDSALQIQFVARPIDGNGRKVDHYEVDVMAGGASLGAPTVTTSSPATVSRLANGTTYDVRVRTVTLATDPNSNDGGPGAWSQTKQGTPAGTPTATIASAAQAGDRAVSASFSVNANGRTITGCSLVVDGVGATQGGCSSITVGGLNYSTTYTLHVYPSYAGGRGPDSAGVQVRTNDPPPPVCQQWAGYAQNQWPPSGAAIRATPAGPKTGAGIAGNTPISFDQWTTAGAAPYPGNPPPMNGNQWLHLADGRGWIAYAAARAVQSVYNANGSGAPDPGVALPPACRV